MRVNKLDILQTKSCQVYVFENLESYGEYNKINYSCIFFNFGSCEFIGTINKKFKFFNELKFKKYKFKII